MNADRSTPLPSLIRIIETSLTVRDIAELSLSSVRPEWSVARAVRRMNARGFDVAPVAEDPPRRYVEKATLEQLTGTVDSNASPIDAPHVVSVDLGLAEAIVLLARSDFFFVLDGSRLTGIVTRADLQKPAVNMVTLSLILASEIGINRLIDEWFGDGWRSSLSPPRLHKAEEVFEARRRNNVEIGLLECLMLEDRLDLLRDIPPALEALDFPSKRSFAGWKGRLRELRNALAHGGDILDVEADPRKAIDLFARVRAFAEGVWRVQLTGRPTR